MAVAASPLAQTDGVIAHDASAVLRDIGAPTPITFGARDLVCSLDPPRTLCRVGFFDDLTPPPRRAESEPETPPWVSAPEGWIGAGVPAQLVIGRSDEAAVALSQIVAYPVGFELTIDAYTRTEQPGFAFEAMEGWHGGGEEREPPELLRYGIQFADGRKASDLGGMFGGTVAALSPSDDPELDPAEDVSLVPGGGHGGGRHSRQEIWAWPLPPPGPVAFVCEWPAYGIRESRVEVDGAVILEAAERAEEIWPTPT